MKGDKLYDRYNDTTRDLSKELFVNKLINDNSTSNCFKE